MPRQPALSDILLNNIIACLAPALALLNDLEGTFATPFVSVIAKTSLSLITAVQTVKRNKTVCIELMDNIHKVLYAIIDLHIKSEPVGNLPPASLSCIGHFTETLHRIHTFVDIQQEGNKIKHFFRQSEMNMLLRDCRAGLQQALEIFKVDAGAATLESIDEMKRKTESIHKELLELIATLSDGTASDRSLSICLNFNTSQDSSDSFSMLPAMPKIFHGRESELESVVKQLTQGSPRIAILGAGGMGKTSLARTALHHSEIVAKYEHRFFVAAESATNSIELAALVGSHLGLKPGNDLTRVVVEYFSRGPPCLLVLDNLETPWESMETRSTVEEFLSLLTDVKHLALIVTMRGVERPAKVRWTRPFLLPLEPLSYEAARQTFFDIADDSYDNKDINKLLSLTDNMPLAVQLIAHLVDYEGCSNVLGRWETEKTSLLSEGYGKSSNLDASIAISLSSPRLISLPGAKQLLSLLAILPDGLSDSELLQSNLPINNILACKAALLQTSLAYRDNKSRLKVLAPIREHMKQAHAPSQMLVKSLFKHFYWLLDLYQKHRGVQLKGIIDQISLNHGNLHQVLLQELHLDNPNLADAIDCTIVLNSCRRQTGHGCTVLMDHIPSVFPKPRNSQVEANFIIEMFNSITHYPITNPELLVAQTIDNFHSVNDPILKVQFYIAIGVYYHHHKDNIPAAMQYFEQALALAQSSGNVTRLEGNIGKYHAGQRHAFEAQKLAQLTGSLYEESKALLAETYCCRALGGYKRAIFVSHRARELVHLCGMSGGTVDYSIMASAAEVHLLKSEYAEARAIHVQIVQNTSADQDPWNYVWGILNIAEIGVAIGSAKEEVHLNLENAKNVFNIIGYLSGPLQCEMILGNLCLREGDTVQAKALLQHCLASFWGKDSDSIGYCLTRLADMSRWRVTDISWISTSTVIYLGYAITSRQKLDLHKALCFLGDIFLSQEDEDTACALYIVALEGFTYMDVHHSRADCMLRLGNIAKHRGDSVGAVKHWKEARALFERSLQAKKVEEIDFRLAAVER
ncbi:hypothetical protein DFH09DRAFT_1279421 [Mycena vulgaris]|nr:hypothetical protein DFH09DRAFT_1279421 [Mycena vulgaris]